MMQKGQKSIQIKIKNIQNIYSSASALTKGFAICSIPSFGAITVMAVPKNILRRESFTLMVPRKNE